MTCDPPSDKPRQVGIRSDDKVLLNGDSISADIERVNSLFAIKSYTDLVPGLVVARKPIMACSVKVESQSPVKIADYSPPPEMIITPGSPEWVDRSVVQAAIAEYKSRVEKQSEEKEKPAPRRKIKKKTVRFDLSELTQEEILLTFEESVQ